MPAPGDDLVSLEPSGHADGDPVRVPPRCLSFTVSSDWGHFRRGEGNLVKRTYRVPPRTTVAGLIAAMLGVPRDQYYELFAKGDSAVAITPVAEEGLRSLNVPINTLDTKDSMRSINSRGRGPKVRYPDPRAPRKQHTYEFLVDPAYRIDVWLDHEEAYERLRAHLRRGTCVYSPSMGLSELLASVTYHGETSDVRAVDRTAADADSVDVDSVLWHGSRHAVGRRGATQRVERTQAFFAPSIDASGRLDRVAAEFVDVGYNPDGEQLPATGARFASVGDRVVMFH
jgi:CRISPR-associated protein Cas5h